MGLPIVVILVSPAGPGLEPSDLTRVNENMYPSAQAAAAFCWLSVRK